MKFFLIFLTLLTNTFAYSNLEKYTSYVDDIQSRFEKAYQAYENGDINSSKKAYQMAYFQVFENLEGPIRINVSVKKARKMEREFGELRKMVINKVPKNELKEAQEDLLKQMREVLPELGEHTLVAQVGDNNQKSQEFVIGENITKDPNWVQTLEIIEQDFQKAFDKYDPNNSKVSRLAIQNAQFVGFRNTQLEIMLRKVKSSQKEGEVQTLFSDLIAFIHTKPSKEALGEKLQNAYKLIAQECVNLPPYDKNKKVEKLKKDWEKIANNIYENISKNLDLSQTNKEEAISNIQDIYFDIFEASGLENAIGAKSADKKAKLESYFTKLIAAVNSNTDKAEQISIFNEFKTHLNLAIIDLNKNENTSVFMLFISSLLIILREGLEALLVVTAIVAYLVKTNNKDKMNLIYSSVGVAVILSFLTAWILHVLFGQAAGVNREILEGVVILFAMVLLLYVSYWLVENAHVQKWNQYIQNSVSQSLSSGSKKALWFTVFLAVYREGAEVVLFYQALAADMPKDGLSYLLGGFVLGCVLLFVIYFILKFTALRLPIRPFFLATGIFIFILAFIFAGQGIAELIEGKLIVPRLVSNFPTFTYLGIFPYVQSLALQASILFIGILGFGLIKKRQTNV